MDIHAGGQHQGVSSRVRQALSVASTQQAVSVAHVSCTCADTTLTYCRSSTRYLYLSAVQSQHQ
jgi:hypothetical protein